MPKTLLLADDSVTIQKVVGISFASEDVTLVTVDNGDSAIAKARELRPDVILADVVMPGKNGYEVCEAIKADPNLRHVPVLLLTGTFEAFDEDRARRAGAAGHVSKPFEAQALVQKVRALLSAPPAPAAVPAAAPAAAPARPSSPPPAPASADEAFDFFDDEAGDLGQGADEVVEAEPAADDALSLDAPEAFAFGSEDEGGDLDALGFEAEHAQVGAAPGGAERTVAILHERGPRGGAALDAIGEGDLDVFAPVVRRGAKDDTAPDPLAPIEPPAAEVFDFDLDAGPGEAEEAAPLRVDSDDLAQATVLDPAGASGYDVSSSDLGDPFEAAPEAPPRAPARGPEPSAGPRPAAGSEPSLAEIAPQLREQLHDTLEKIAWESFSDVTERIVRQALERVESVAWEVIPQLAEALVREEIRRMKGEQDD
jgi:CheY-like chemotaxis protein